MSIENKIESQKKGFIENEKEILYSDFRDDSDIYDAKSDDIVYFKENKPVTRKEEEDRVKKIFGVKLY